MFLVSALTVSGCNQLEPDNHFKKMLIHFHKTIFDKTSKEQENIQNLIQAQLLQDIKNKSNEK